VEWQNQATFDVNHCTADWAYNDNPTYQSLSDKFPKAKIVIPPDKNVVLHDQNHIQGLLHSKILW
jgi:hypothetical protein